MGQKRKYITILLAIFSLNIVGAKTKSYIEPQPIELVSVPTAGLIPKGDCLVSFVAYSPGGINSSFIVGAFQFLNLGLGYGGTNIIGDSKPNWNKKIFLKFKARIINESMSYPALAFGFDSQGYGEYYSSRYYFKSPGIFLVLSKNYYFLGGDLSFHIGANYSVLEKDNSSSPDLFFGLIKSWGDIFILGEYRAGFDDKEGKKVGYLNSCLGMFFGGKKAKVEFVVMDMLDKKGKSYPYRGLRVGFMAGLF